MCNKLLLNCYYHIVLFFSVATFEGRGVCFSYLGYHSTFSSLVVIKLFFEMIFFLKIIHSMKCQNLRKSLLKDVEVLGIGSIICGA